MRRKIFIDCGFYIGNAIKIYQEEGVIDESWKVYAFEPYPKKNMNALLEARLPLKVDLIEKAVWLEDGESPFVIKGREDAHHINYEGQEERDKIVTAHTINFSKFVDELPETYIICSMDIEGAEFWVLEQMLKDNSIDKIDILDIEFHHRLLHGYTEKSAEQLIKKIEARGVEVRLKVPLI